MTLLLIILAIIGLLTLLFIGLCLWIYMNDDPFDIALAEEHQEETHDK